MRFLVTLLMGEIVLLTTTTTTTTTETTSKSPVPLGSKKRPSEEHFETQPFRALSRDFA